jgi:hypothetical protein
MKHACVCVALTACSIRAIDYTGKACPCPEGYRCDVVTDTCTVNGVSGVDASLRDGSVGDAVFGDSCLPSPRSQLIYSSVGFTDFPAAWLNGLGQWATQGNELVQTNSDNILAFLSHSVGGSNYRIVATMRYIDSANGGSAGIALRINANRDMYTCTFDPISGELDIQQRQNNVDIMANRLIVDITNTRSKFTLEADVSGANLVCCLRGVAGATVTAPSTTLATGSPGIVTRDSSSAFSSFFAYQ